MHPSQKLFSFALVGDYSCLLWMECGNHRVALILNPLELGKERLPSLNPSPTDEELHT